MLYRRFIKHVPDVLKGCLLSRSFDVFKGRIRLFYLHMLKVAYSNYSFRFSHFHIHIYIYIYAAFVMWLLIRLLRALIMSIKNIQRCIILILREE